ncbi:hypothetical protein XMD517_001364 [Aliiroseovarius sp. xm-d-517]|nr:hypothetical protein [Aliiroseovarius sp. xm-d-517]NRP42548.1 hypothetical protein [Aliiroseovarius sp. xm-m-339-2]NRP63460.1 hypothetical protein [Aliiroseovarius sp. xm-a-151]
MPNKRYTPRIHTPDTNLRGLELRLEAVDPIERHQVMVFFVFLFSRNVMTKKPNLPVTFGGRSAASREYRNQKREAYAAENKRKVCSISNCDRQRYNLSTYCLDHNKRYRRYGRAIGNLPTQSQLQAIEGAIRDWFEGDYLTTDFDRKKFKASWGSAQRTIRNHPSFALPFYRLEGHEGFTQQAKGWVILSHYYHRQNNSLSDAMVRYMACRLWSEFLWEMPEGKRKFKREKDHFVNTWAGYFVLRNSGFSKTKTEETIIGWKKPWYISDDPRQNLPIPITKKTEKKVYISDFKAGPIVRAIGKELNQAVEHAIGKNWVSDHRLLSRTVEALGLTHLTPSNQKK